MTALCECGARRGLHRYGDEVCPDPTWRPGRRGLEWSGRSFKLAPAIAPAPAPSVALTSSERLVLDALLVHGTAKGIARGLDLSHRTVECHLFRVYAKLKKAGVMEQPRRIPVMLWWRQEGGAC
jgi:hypothetical protein